MSYLDSVDDLFDHYLAKVGGHANAAAILVDALVRAAAKAIPQKLEFLSVRQAATAYGVSEKTIRKMIDEGLPVVRIGDGPRKAIRIKRKDLWAWIEGREVKLR